LTVVRMRGLQRSVKEARAAETETGSVECAGSVVVMRSACGVPVRLHEC
jgi:hypothetical protein